MDTPVGVLAGTASTALFIASALPMLVKAVRTKDLTSYSAGNIVLANLGNLVYAIYVFSLPAGPIWALHSFTTVSNVLMLIWFVRYRRRDPSADQAPSSSLARRVGGATTRKDSRQIAFSSSAVTVSSSTPSQPRWPT
jgi:uncharacterized protein with PQ loop repeat